MRRAQPKSVLSLYVDEPIGMEHPFFAARMQAGIDARLAINAGIPQAEATEQIVERLRGVMGQDVPYELIAIPVMLAYQRSATTGEDSET